jgi:Protein of unknown function (DUF2384)
MSQSGSYGKTNGSGLQDKKAPPKLPLPEQQPERELLRTHMTPSVRYGSAGGGYAVLMRNEPVPIGLPRGRITGPVVTFARLLNQWHLNLQDAAILLGSEPSDLSYVRSILGGLTTLRKRDEKDRIAYLFRIKALLASLFRNDGYENEWLRQPHAALGGESPLALLREGSMRNLIRVVDYVEHISGK